MPVMLRATEEAKCLVGCPYASTNVDALLR